MGVINEHFNRLTANYLFAEIANRVSAYKEANKGCDLISMGIGDVTRPLPPVVVEAIQSAAQEMGDPVTFRGYGPYEGYGFLREAIARYYQDKLGVEVNTSEIFVASGAKDDLGAILDLFRQGVTAIIPDPVYPAYLDVSAITGNDVIYIDGNESNGFLPGPPDMRADLVYLCSPNNPTGAVYTRQGLKEWVNYANRCGAIILFDAAYESFVSDPGLPRSILSIPGARTCAIELCSFSKTAGFTGVRCGYTVIPMELERQGSNIGGLWNRRLAIKYNGASYIVQKAAEAVLSDEGYRQIRVNTESYLANAKEIAKTMDELGIQYTGGDNSPYIWFRCPGNMGSWQVFDMLLAEANVVCTPGAGFGRNGEGWVRLSAFGGQETTREAMRRVKRVLERQG